MTSFVRYLSVLLLVLVSMPSLATAPEIIKLRTPPPIPHGYYIRDVLSLAYSNIGYKVDFVTVPSAQELVMAKRNELAGVLAKDVLVEENYPNLIRVEQPLFKYKVLYVADRRACGYCFYDSIDVIGYPQGGIVFPALARTFFKNAKLEPLTWSSDVENVVSKGLLPAFMTTDIGLSAQVIQSPHTILHELDERYDFHYLSSDWRFLKPLLENELQRLEKEGALETLRIKHGISDTDKIRETLDETPVTAISGEWWEYTERDGSGVYWELIKEALHRRVPVELEATSWIRAVRLFAAQKVDMLVGAYRDYPSGYIASKYHIDYESEILVVAKSEDILERFNQGDMGLTACASETFEVIKVEAKKHAYLHQADYFKCEELFLNDRVDLVIDYEYNMFTLTSRYASELFHESLPLHVLFQDTIKGRLLKEQFDQGMERAAKKNKLKQHFLNEEDFIFARITETNESTHP